VWYTSSVTDWWIVLSITIFVLGITVAALTAHARNRTRHFEPLTELQPEATRRIWPRPVVILEPTFHDGEAEGWF
jgi:hypothetical protein